MATVMLMHWPNASQAEYDAVRAKVRWEDDRPDGAQMHICGFADDRMHVVDVWDSEEAFNNFMNGRLGPAIAEVGIHGEPMVQFYPAHGIYVPALGKNEQTSEY